MSQPSYLKGLFNTSRAMGDRVVSSDAYFVIDGYEDTLILIKQFPHPVVAPAGEIEVPLPTGGTTWQAQQIQTARQGPVAFFETKQSTIKKMLVDITANGGHFDATMYEGEVDNPTDSYRLQHCFITLDPPDRDFENRAQLLLITGTIFYNYFGEGAA